MTSGFFFGTTRYVRFSRLKLPTNSRTCTRPSCWQISFRTSGIAVAVRAITGAVGNSFLNRAVPVLGPEVVAPFRDAVRFVDCDQPDRGRCKGVKKTGLHAFLRRDKQEVEPALLHLRLDPGALPVVERTVAGGGQDPPGVEVVHLVFHERDERRNDHGEAAEVQGRQPVAERLPAPGCHDRERIVSCKDRCDDRFLVRAEGRITPVFPEQGEGSLLRSGAVRAVDACGAFMKSPPGPRCAARALALCDEECGRTVYEAPGAGGETDWWGSGVGFFPEKSGNLAGQF